jgi:Icc protein
MRLAWLTDVHLDHASAAERERLVQDVRAADAHAVLLGGDTATSASLGWHLRTFRDRVGIPVYFVLGNHDCYGSSIAETRELARKLTEAREDLTWMGAAGVIPFTERTALIGHDGWGDAGFGNPETKVMLNDFLMIQELRLPVRAKLLAALKQLGAEAGAHLRRVGGEAVKTADSIITLTHVPPFRQAAWHEGAESNADWLPFFACRAAGEALLEVMREHPEKRMTVLCGHTHGGGRYEAAANIEVLTGPAVYGEPKVQRVIEVS